MCNISIDFYFSFEDFCKIFICGTFQRLEVCISSVYKSLFLYFWNGQMVILNKIL